MILRTMLKYIDWVHDRVTMYRLLLYYLIYLLAAAAALAALGYISYTPYAIVLSAAYLTAVCWTVNKVFAYVFKAPANKESSLITALILALIIQPAGTLQGVAFLTAAGVLAIASKYILAVDKTHIFNPVAIGVALTSLGAGQAANWWVGSTAMLPFVLLGGLTMTRKVRRWQMVLSFLGAAYAATALYTLLADGNIVSNLNRLTLHSSVFFLAFVMLTEPSTSPAGTGHKRWYGAMVGVLFPPQVHIASVYSTPELALMAGNVFTRLIEPRPRIFPSFLRKTRLAPDIAEFVFKPGRDFQYKAGQYMEWTLPHNHPDARGERRYLTLASSPTESELRLGIRFYPGGSSYKKAMLKISPGDSLVAARLAGDFTLPGDRDRKLAFIAGGIGVTPYRSMVKYLLDSQENRDIAMIYSAAAADRLVYKEVFDEAGRRFGMKTTYQIGNITPELIRRGIPDYDKRLFYVSGPQIMVDEVKTILHGLGVRGSRIRTDFFPGYN